MKKVIYIALVDDNPVINSENNTLLKKYFASERQFVSKLIIHSFASGALFLESSQKYDLVLMDYEMQGLNGIETVKRLEERGIVTKVLFLSGYEHPIKPLQQATALKSVSGYVFKNDPQNQLLHLIQQTVNEILDVNLITFKQFEDKHDPYLEKYVKVFDVVTIDSKKIITIEAKGKTIFIYSENGDEFMTLETLKSWSQKLLEMDFAYANKSCLVNFKYVTSITNKEVHLLHSDSIKLSREFKKTFTEKRKNYKIREALK